MPRSSGNFNGQISGPSAGRRQVRIDSILNGLDIIASSDAEGRSRRAFYPVTADSSSFSVTLTFISWSEREDFNNWMSKFMVAVSEGTAKNGVLTVRCPSRNFIRTGVPQGPLAYGEGLGDLAYATQMSFVGASDPTDPTLSAKKQGASSFQSGANDSISRFFYPTTQQIKGAEAADSTIFGDTPDGASINQILPSTKAPILPGQAGQ